MATPEAMKIRDALASVLEEKLDFTGAISFHRAYTDAPNPGLQLSDLGLIGLPLNPREAQAIKTHAQQAPFGMGERTVVDTSVRDTWEMNADKVVFRNPAWKVWLEGVVKEVCRTLGVNYAASQPRSELYKLLLYETGSHFLPHVDTEKVDGMFATIVVVLPSPFTGGAAHLSHGSQSAVYDCSRTSDLQTSVMAWYTDVMHEVKPIASGYRLALSYNLLHTTNALRPALSNNDKGLNAFRQVLLAWKAGAGSGVPEKIVYLLAHKYSQANLRGSALKGSDAQKVAILDILGKELGFSLGFASVECHVEGAPDDDGGGYYGRRRNCYWDKYDDDGDDEGLSFIDVFERSMSLTDFVNLDGEKVAEEIEISGTTETIPDDLEETVTSGDHDEQEYEGYMGNGAGTLERWYRRTVLVIWPKFADCLVTDDLEGVCVDLRDEADKTDAATPAQRATIKFLLSRNVSSSDNAVTVADAVCHATCHWHDLELWKSAVETCSRAAGVVMLDIEDVCTAIKTFGFEAVRPSLEIMIRQEKRNKQVFTFLDEFRTFDWDEFEEDFGDGDDAVNDQLVSAVLEWIDTQWTASLKALRAISKDDFATLSQLAADNGGLAFVRDTIDNILPQLVKQKDASILREYAAYIANEQDTAENADTSLKRDVVSQILKASISELTITLPPVAPSAYGYPRRPNPTEPSFEVVKPYFETCIALNYLDHAGDVIAKVADTTGLSVAEAQRRAKLLMLPFLTWVAQFLAQQPNITEVPKLDVLQKASITPILEEMAGRRGDITREEVGQLLQTVSLPGGMDMFVTSILPKLNTLASSEASSKAILEELQPRLAQLILPASYQGPSLSEIITSVAKKYAQYASINTTEAVIVAMDCCIRMQALDGVWGILNRVLDPKKLKESTGPSYSHYTPYAVAQWGTYANTVVLPLVAHLRQLALKHDMLTALAPAFRQIARTYTQKVLGHVPSADPEKRLAQIRRWTCKCVHCNTVRTFLLAKPDPAVSLQRIGAPQRKHVEGFLNQYVTSEGATWSTISTSPQGITVTKTDLLLARAVWKANQKKAIQLVKDASPDEQERMQIYGDEYAEYARWIKGIPTLVAAALQQQRAAAAAGPSASTASASRAAPVPTPGASALQHQRAAVAAGPSTSVANPPAATAGVRRPSNTHPNQTLPPAKRAKTASGPLNVIAVIDLTES